MDALTATAAAGIRSRVEALDLLANNLANANSTGYKADRELYRRYAAGEAYDSTTGAFDPTQQPDIDSRWTDFSPYTMEADRFRFANYVAVHKSVPAAVVSAIEGRVKTRLLARAGR